VVTIVIVTPLLPGLAHAISPANVNVNSSIDKLYAISWLYGFHASIALYYALAYIWPVTGTLVPKSVSGSTAESIEGVDVEERIHISVPEDKTEKTLSS
jgi:NCS1 family nucleobase:cation symporter-1